MRKRRLALAVGLLALVTASAYGASRYWTEQRESAVITPLEAIVAAVQRVTPPGQLVYGDYELTPLVALLADRRIFRNYADTNVKFFQTGYFSYESRMQELVEANVSTIITKALVDAQGAILSGPERVLPIDFFKTRCTSVFAAETPRDYSYSHVIVWTCGR